MPDATSSPTGRRYSDDLRRIREARGLTLEALHEETKIPLGLLQEFEETGLFEHPMFNRVYLRSLVRAYASFVEISTPLALECLDGALLGTYRGRLAVEYLGEEPDPTPEEAPPQDSADEDSGEAPAETKPPPHQPPPAAAPSPVAEPALPSVGRTWVSKPPPPRSRLVDFKERATYTQWVLIAMTVVVFVGAIWVVLSLIDRPDAADDAPPAVVQDTLPAVEQPPPRLPITVGDTLDVVVVAALGKIERLLVRRDDDLRRPYWIEEGRAEAFPALERIVFENRRLERMRLLVEGYDYPVDRLDEEGRLVVTRQSAQAFLDTVTAPPVDLSLLP